MPRSKPKLGQRGASSVWLSRPFCLDEKTQTELAECIGLIPSTNTLVKVLNEVQRLLALYGGAVQAVDNAPRPADYVREYRQLSTQADALSKGLRELSPRVREQLEAWLMDDPAGSLESTEQGLDALRRALKELQRNWSAKGQSAGRPRKSALRMTVQGLQAVFRQHYAGPRRPGRKRGAFKTTDEATARERRFITVALRAARIPTTGLIKLLS
jgi:hypothetical protein